MKVTLELPLETLPTLLELRSGIGRTLFLCMLALFNYFGIVKPKETTEDAAERLGGLIDELAFVCPDATILIARPMQQIAKFVHNA